MLRLIEISGWGISSSMWITLNDYLQTTTSLSLQILHSYPYDNNTLTKLISSSDDGQTILIGHSLGGLKALQYHNYTNIKASILINSFAKFSSDDSFQEGINPQYLKLMKKQLVKNKKKTLNKFFNDNNIPNLYQSDHSEKHLLAGLNDLLTLDYRNRLEEYNNIYAFSSNQDILLSNELQTNALKSIHNHRFASRSHILPISESKSLGKHIKSILESI